MPSPSRLPQVTFWPRPQPRPSALERDIYCDKCGYNLKGLTNLRCPECGAVFSPRRASTSLIPWRQRDTIGWLDAYWRTVRLVMFDSKRFLSEVREGGRLSLREANRFRRITVLHALFPLIGLWICVAGQFLEQYKLFIYTIFAAPLLLLWLDRSTRLLVSFLEKQVLPSDVQRRTVALANYSSAPLALTALHLPALATVGVIYRTQPAGALLQAAIVGWAFLALLQLACWWLTSLMLVKATMNSNDTETLMLGIALALAWAVQAAWYLLAVPVICALILDQLFRWL